MNNITEEEFVEGMEIRDALTTLILLVDDISDKENKKEYLDYIYEELKRRIEL